MCAVPSRGQPSRFRPAHRGKSRPRAAVRSRAPRRHLTRGPGPDHGQGDTVAPTGARGSSPSCCDKVRSGPADHEVIRKEPSDPAAPTIASSSARSRSDRIPSLRGEIDSGHQEADAMARRAQCSGGHEEAGEARNLRGRGALPLGRRGTPALAPTNSWAGDGQVLHPRRGRVRALPRTAARSPAPVLRFSAPVPG